MKMYMFATLAKARLNIKSMKISSLVADRHMTDQLSGLCGYILGQYMNIKHSLLYKTWAAGLIRCRRRMKKEYERKNEKT
jgi:hypothetical protein